MRWVVLLVLGLAAAVAAAPTPVALNPPDTDGVVYGTLRITELAGRACVNVELLEEDPPDVSEGEAWLIHNNDTDRHELCFYKDGLPHCIDAVAPPTPIWDGYVQYLRNTMTPTRTPTATITGTITPAVDPQYLVNTRTPSRTPTSTNTPTVTP